MKRIFLVIIPMLILTTSCNLDFFPSDELSPDQLSKDPGGALYITDGNYSIFKDEFEYRGMYASGNSYVRHYFQMTEYPSDNICLSGRTPDVLYEATCYKTNPYLKNVQTFWWLAYRIIYGANSVIEFVQDGASVDSDYLKGENYFLRAICHLHLVTLYAKPYSHGRENPGIVIRKSTNTMVTERAKVGEVYDQIVDDLLNAIRLMEKGSRRGNAGYASKEAAMGLLTRVYLYMERNQEVVGMVDNMLAGATPASKLEPTASYPNYFANALSSVETLWAVAHTSVETKGQSSGGSMYLKDGIGWGEVYSSDPLNTLYERYPNDVRYSYVVPQYRPKANTKMIYWPVYSEGDDFRANEIREVTVEEVTNKYFFTENAVKIYVETETVNTYDRLYINWKGAKQYVRLTPEIMIDRYTYPNYFMSKFSYQDGDPMLSSPVMLRWAEVILNRAEAYAKLGDNQKALDDVNVMRTRAGLKPDELFTIANMAQRGYSKVLDVVLDERRLELSFEGHRMFDLYRNKMDMNREFAGVHPWEIVKWNDDKIQYPIPFDEVSVSGIEQNPYYK